MPIVRVLVLFLLLGLALLGGILAFGGNTRVTQTAYLYIADGSSLESVLDTLRAHDVLRSETSFRLMASLVGYGGEDIRPGRYAIEPGMSNFRLLRNLVGGRQTPVRLTIPTDRQYASLLRRCTNPLQMKPDSLRAYIEAGHRLDSLGLDVESAELLFLPLTHEVYWNVRPNELYDRLASAYTRFWTPERKQQAQRQGLTPREVGILASIVESETNHNDERPRIAGVYLNRLRKDMRLQADPTVVWAVGDFSITRVTAEHLRVDSPYNTYKYKGLPPGPICNPSLASLQAVLNAESHNYLFFAAKPDGSGYHHFSVTFDEHRNAARAYHSRLDSLGL
jgi:UPF0755 protein